MTLAVMISYPSEKREQAKQAANTLESYGLNVWVDWNSLVPGDDWEREIEQAIRTSELVVVLTSKETIMRPGVVQQELRLILENQHRQPSGSNYIVNLRTEPVTPPSELASFHWTNMYESNWEQHLLRGIVKRYNQLDRALTPELQKALERLSEATDTLPRAFHIKADNQSFSATYFLYSLAGDYFDFVNAEITAHVFREFFRVKSQFGMYEQNRPMTWSIQLEEFFRKDDLISLRFSWTYDAGGPHPHRGTQTINFGGEWHGRIALPSLLEFSKKDETIKHVRRFCELDIQRQFLATGEEIEISFANTVPDETDWEPFEDFSFNERGITFNFSPYDVLAYSFGSHEVVMPWTYFRNKVDEQYRRGHLYDLIIDSSAENG